MIELVDRILDDLNDRKGFHLTDEIRGWLRDAWSELIEDEHAVLQQIEMAAHQYICGCQAFGCRSDAYKELVDVIMTYKQRTQC